ncbi:hypothetical protein P6U16_07420 [Rhizobium sp. 32-5/1]|uniref:hypothetical protein n=1 Tax=Rhizobium sp. 32-5/1 TaxID=3019602 RepID=UPI00240DCA65|nr:hypothetical protein [Rhizobium sp. 32-5/1]WEZ84446.1 hypothetical protein P6U16_07420 [Rhizobium sp. 32-5/1]
MSELYKSDLEQALKAFIADHPGIHSREEAIAAVLENWFSTHGYLPTGQTGTRPEDLDATNDD